MTGGTTGSHDPGAGVPTGADVPTADRPLTRGRRALVVAASVLLGAVVVFDAAGLAAVQRNRAALTSTRHDLATERAELSADTARLTSGVGRLRWLEDQEASTTDRLGATDRSIDAADGTGSAAAADVDALDTCLAGVSEAGTAIDAADPSQVLTAVTAVSSTCLTLGGSTGGLVYPFNFPDPSVLRVGAEYYGFSTNAVVGNVQVIVSSDLTHWTPVGDALPRLPSWAVAGDTWHPSVLQRGGTFVLYYAVEDGATGQECVSDATASQPQGPYTDSSSAPLECQQRDGGSLDPSPFVGTDGRPYLVWKSQGTDGSPPVLWSQELDADGTALVPGEPSELLAPDQAWESGIVEGPDMAVAGGHYLLLFGGNDWQTASYGVGVADCAGPLGPCTASAGDPLVASDSSMRGPGGPSLFTDTGGDLWLAFHAWLPGEVGYPNGRALFIRRVVVTDGRLSVVP